MALIKNTLIILLCTFVLTACDPNQKVKVPETKEELVEQLIQGAEELGETSKPDRVKAWVDNLIVKSQPEDIGQKMPEVARMVAGEEATYLYQRTYRKFEHVLRGQKYKDSWYLIRTKDNVMGWVHGGGIEFVDFDINSLFVTNKKEEKMQTRSLDKPSANSRISPTAAQSDWQIIPGKRVGSIKLTTSEQDLVRMYGTDNVKRGNVAKTGKEKESCTLVYPGTKDELAITWQDDTRSKVKAIYIQQAGAKWRTAEGLRTGISILALTKINQSPLEFYGLDWEYGGTIKTWKKGKLAPKEKQFYAVLSSNLKKSSPETRRGFSGNRIFSSNDRDVDKLHLYLSKLVIYLD